MRVSKIEINSMKREVKKTTGRNMCDIEITCFGSDFIEWSYYANNYDRVNNKLTFGGKVKRSNDPINTNKEGK